jgi:hypothetical protein
MNTKGQSLIELIMILPILIAFWAAIAWFAQAFIISIELMHTARHGAFWLAYNSAPMDPDEEIQQVKHISTTFLASQAPGLDPNRITFTVKPGDRWRPDGPKTLFDVPGLIVLQTRLKRTFKKAAGLVYFYPADVTVRYTLGVPRVLRLMPGFPSTIPLEGRCVVYR